MILVDEAARIRILTSLEDTLLVEAAAGTGKTALLAGRATMLLAAGVPPTGMAAITFTELAAGELAQRVREYVGALLEGRIPAALRVALPEGPTEEQIANLSGAAKELDALAICTIHGFCQSLLTRHAVDAGLDPGARVLDAATSDSLFDDELRTWLVARLDALPADEALQKLAAENPLGILQELAPLARLKMQHPTASTMSPLFDRRADVEFVEAVRAFSRWHAASPGEEGTWALLQELEKLAAFFNDALALRPSFERLWNLSRPPRVNAMENSSLRLRAYRRRSSWTKRCGPDVGSSLADQAEKRFAEVAQAYDALLGCIADAMVGELSRSMDDLVRRYSQTKQRMSALDFDDLLRLTAELLRSRDDIRRTLHERYRAVLVDEFQDTDAIQTEILFSIAAEGQADDWSDAILRPGALFLVGDPKQSIYRFRGADIDCYRAAKEAILRQRRAAVLHVSSSFRSRKGVLGYVNAAFEPVLGDTDQPGYVRLEGVRGDGLHLSVARLTVTPEDTSPQGHREEEARAVAGLCSRLIGALEVERDGGVKEPLRAGDIALLAPTANELWRYERALEDLGIPFASQAGRSLFLKQETQDVLALLRTLADPSDRIALFAFLRGPSVGVADDDLLDVDHAVRTRSTETMGLSIRTDATLIEHPLVRQTLLVLQRLRGRRDSTTPSQLLAEAIEALRLRPILAARHRGGSDRAMANLDAVVQILRRHDVSGLRSAVRQLQADWQDRSPMQEGRVDSDRDAVELVTMHSAKGLEWPVVVPINSMTSIRAPSAFLHRRSDDTIHWSVGGVHSPHMQRARDESLHQDRLERQRLWYVSCTRARDLLILPYLPGASSASWSRVMHLRQSELPEFQLDVLRPAQVEPLRPIDANEQDAATFERELRLVASASPEMHWRLPSLHDEDRPAGFETRVEELDTPVPVDQPQGAGRLRGLVLHKLMEEFMTSQTPATPEATEARALVLIDQISPASMRGRPDAVETARTALRTWNLPELKNARDRLTPEVGVWDTIGQTILLAGRADAIVVDAGRIECVFDWKSDVFPSETTRRQHERQLLDYMGSLRCPTGRIVYMSTGLVVELRREFG